MASSGKQIGEITLFESIKNFEIANISWWGKNTENIEGDCLRRKHLMIAFKNGIIILVDDETDENPVVIKTELKKITKTQWEVDGLCFAVLGELVDTEAIKEEEDEEEKESKNNESEDEKEKEKDKDKENNKEEEINTKADKVNNESENSGMVENNNKEKNRQEQQKEEEKIQFYIEEKRKAMEEKEIREKIRKKKEKLELKKFLDMQVEEKKKEKTFLKELEHEQARIWNIDVQKYNEDSKMIDNKYKMMKKKNFEYILKQMKENDEKKIIKHNCDMTNDEYEMNKELLKQAKKSFLNEEKNK